jgi:flavin-dependent dehydrogenase
MTGSLGEHRCAKGEILTLKADWPQTHIRIGAGGWLVPIGDGCFRVGSTYEWNQLDEKPTNSGLERITSIATKLGGSDFEVIAHVAGIRPILRRSEPLIGKDASGDWIFNGLRARHGHDVGGLDS